MRPERLVGRTRGYTRRSEQDEWDVEADIPFEVSEFFCSAMQGRTLNVV